MDIKTCSRCGVEKPFSAFRTKPNTLEKKNVCSECENETVRIRYWKNHSPDKDKTFQQQKFKDDSRLYNKEWVYNEHVIKHRTFKDIAFEIGVNEGTVRYNALKLGVPSNGKAVGHNPNSAKLTKEYLVTEYLTKSKPYSTIAKECGVSVQTVCNYIKKYEIMPRDYVDCHLGKTNGNWHGGLSFKKYCFKFNNEFKRCVRESFDFRCYLCGVTEYKRKHSVHHIDYNRNSICKGKSWAFVPLCISCHMKTNTDRWYWFNLLINYWVYEYDESVYLYVHKSRDSV